MSRMHSLLLALSVLAAAAGCQAGDEVATSENALVDGTPEAIGLIAFLNDPATTLSVLDDQVPLDSRAAGNLIARRDGVDGAFGTADDTLFRTVADVADVPWVGEASIARLVAFADARGFVPSGDDVLGTFDGVTFTVAEAGRVLQAVNDYSDGVLRYEVPLDSRAVNSIIAARPIPTMGELADLYYVGTAMLNRLKDYTALPAATDRPDCRSTAECPGTMRCTGVPYDGSSELGKCYDPAPIPGSDASCSPTQDCGPDLTCLGIVSWGDGFCVPAWQRDVFENDVQRNIPQDGTVVATAVVVRGQATVPVDISVTHDIRHSDPHSLRVTLRSSRGYESVMWDGPNESGAMPEVLTKNCCIPSDDTGNGRWWLLIENVGGTGTGNSYGWLLDITSQWD